MLILEWKSEERCCPKFGASCFLQVWDVFGVNLFKMFGKPISITYELNFGSMKDFWSFVSLGPNVSFSLQSHILYLCTSS